MKPETKEIKQKDSTPFIITVTNRHWFKTYKNVPLVDCYKTLWPKSDWKTKIRNFFIRSSYGYANITITQFCVTLIVQLYRIAQIRLLSKDSHTVQRILSVKTSSIDGSFCSKPYIPCIDPYQQQSGICDVPVNFMLSHLTTITIEELKPRTSITVQLYPMSETIKN